MHHFRRINGIALVALLLASTVAAIAQNQGSEATTQSIVETADLILCNGQIYTPRGWTDSIEMSPYIWYPNPIIPDIAQAIGPERMKRWTPVKDAIDSGALVVPGSDWNVVPSVDPWIAIETLVTRQTPGGGGEALGEAEKITLQQAFDLFTVNSARHMGNRSKTGSIERGMLADLLVLDRNPFKIPVTQIHKTKVTLTFINGEVVYQAPASTKGAD